MFQDVIQAFASAAKDHGQAAALVQGSVQISYADLDRLSNVLADRLITAGVSSGGLVGLAATQDPGTIISILAILKTGAGYVPLPGYYPQARLRLMAEDAGLALILGSVPTLMDMNIAQIGFDWQACTETASPPLPTPDGEAVAYVMYTSGSTGVPKGVVVPHRAILRLVQGQNFMDLGPDERILQNSAIAFDAATLEIWGALLNGGALVLPEDTSGSLSALGEVIRDQRITSLWLTAGLFHAMADTRPGDFAPLRQLLTGGDVVSPASVAKVMAACPGLVVINGYGPTENTTFTCCHTITRAEAELGMPLPIGKPISGTDVFVLDANLAPVPNSESGELFAAGEGLALGYLGRADLTAEKFIAAPWDGDVALYRTGDLVRQDANGVVQYLGRIDNQVKIRGFRIELGEVEAALEATGGISQAVVVARAGADHADKMLVAYCVAGAALDEAALRASLGARLPDYAVPSRFVTLPALPLNSNGKVDRRALEALTLPKAAKQAKPTTTTHSLEEMIAGQLATALGVDEADLDRSANFFDLGASSLHVARVHDGLQTALDRRFPISDFFLHSTIAAMAAHLGKPAKAAGPVVLAPKADRSETGLIAIIGLAGRFPGARSAEEFWDGLVAGREMISQFTPEELDVDLSKGDTGGGFVNARGVMPDADMFDAKHFNIPPREAERMDPQHRILLEVAQTALDNAGHDPAQFAGRIGIYAGSSQNSYLLNNLLSAPGASRSYAASYPLDDFATLFGNDKDFIATRIAYKLNLRGPAATVLCACSTSLVAVAQGCESLANGTSDMVLAGGVSVTFPSKRNYKYMPDGMASADGHCRTFDADATGTVFGDGAGLVVLRRLEDALADGDNVIAVIRGYSINNDGSEKAGYAAPSIKAQAAVIRAAHAAARVSPREIGYIEAHGTATPLGDPIEFAALHEAFSASTDARGFCALGSAKTNVGHLDIAAGITGLIKAALTLKHGVIPPLLHFKAPNPRMDFAGSAFYPVAKLTDWPRGDAPRLAGVSAFGVGGTNIHMVLQEAPQVAVVERAGPHGPQVYPVSASSPEALKAAVAELGAWAAANPQADAGAVRATLRRGRHAYTERAVLVADGLAGLTEAAQGFAGKSTTAGRRDAIAFLFPGQGAQHVGMAKALFDAEPVFREALSLCTTLLKPVLGLDLLDVIHAPDNQREQMTARLKDTSLAQPAIFSIGYALAKQWDHWGIRPDVMVGHSIGEFAAATIAGVIDLPDALGLIALRGRLMADLPGGVMVSVRASEEELQPYLGAGLDLAAVNGAKACVLAGSEEAAAALLPTLEAAGFVTSRLHTSHAFHSYMMEQAVAPFRAAVAKIKLRAPKIPILSTVIGDWLTEQEATDPDYWAGHMRRPVRFYDAMQTLWGEGRHIFLETGPGRTMSTLAGQNPDRRRAQPALASLPHAQAENADAHLSMLEAFGGLWANGYPVDWSRLEGDGPEPKRATGLPTYPFQRKRFWVEPVDVVAAPATVVALEAAPADDQITAPVPQISAADALRDMLSDLSGVEPAEMDGGASFLELGFDSLLLTQATRELSERFGVTVTLRQLIDGFPTIDTLAAHIDAHGNLAGRAPADRTPLAEMTRIEGKPEDEAEATPSSAPMTRISRETEDLTPAQRGHIDALVARYTAKTAKSKALTAQYRGVHADPRTASGFNRLWKEIVYQIVTVKSKGSRLIDVDGNEYIDILNGFGPGFLGHAPEQVVSALHNQLDAGFEVGPQSLAAMEAADLFCQVTGNDRASFVCTGSEAVYAAMRLARTCTGRDRIVMFARDYHGNFDEVLVRGIDGKDGPRSLPMAPGIPRDSVKNVVVLPYGSPQALDYIRRHAGTIAAVIVEPVQSRRPEFRPAEFIREVRRITENAGSLFIFDEVVTGFRFGPRGAQGYYGVDADLVTYGKVVGGGMPVGVVSGKARFMDTFDGGQWQYGDDSFPEAPVTFFAGTFVRHPLAMAALKAMLTFFKTQPDFFWKTVNAKGDKLAGTVDRWFADNDMPFQMPNCGSLMYLRIGEDQKYGGLLGAGLRDRGVFMLEGFPSYMTAAHDDQDIDHVIEAVKDTALEMRAAGMLVGREAVAYDGPHLHKAPPRLSLPGGEAAIAAAMAAPLGTLSVPTTEAQREIWAAMIVTPEVAPAYNESVTLKLHGVVDRDMLRAAAQTVFRRHDALRSTFSDDGMEMHIQPDLDIDLPLVDLTSLAAEDQASTLAGILRQEVETPFDMVLGPFVRAHLVAFGADHHHLIITAHHIVCDGWSIDVIMRDIGAVYSALLAGQPPTLPPAQSIIDYARAEAEWSRSEDATAARTYWLDQFAGDLPVLDLPTDHPRPPIRTVAAQRFDAVFSQDLVGRLRKTATAQGSTLVTLLLAGFKLYLARITGSNTVVVGVPAAGQAARGMPQLVGHCVNLMPLRSQIDREARFPDFLRTVRNTMLDGNDHQHYAFGSLVRDLRVDRDPSRIPITPIMFNIDNGIDLSDMRFGDAATEFVSNPRRFENFEIFLNVTNTPSDLLAEWTYNTGLFDAETIKGHMAGLSVLLEKIVTAPDSAIADLLALLPQEAAALAAVARPPQTAFPPVKLHQLIEARAAELPDTLAVESAKGRLSYAALDALANQIAQALIARGVQPGDRVGVSLDRGPSMIAGLLAVLKANAAYVPLDPAFPPDRLAYMVSDSGAGHILADASTRPLFGQGGPLNILDLDADHDVIAQFTPKTLISVGGPETLAYVLYTSGSTGRPKGVSIPHRAFVNFITSMLAEPGIGAGDRLLAVTTISFDIAGLEIWGPLVAGGTVVLAERADAVDARQLRNLIDTKNISIMQATPSTWQMLIDDGWAGDQRLKVLVGGEGLPSALAAALLARCGAVWNMYGPTETTVWSTIKKLTTQGRITIGRPIANTEIAILDAALRPVPPGVAGELFIGGAGLAVGYFGRADLTAELFINNPDGTGTKLYRTGDLARWVKGTDGYEIECLGRIDTQVKLRGYRIELGEIEAALEAHAQVRRAVVLVREIASGDARLMSYMTLEPGDAPFAQALRAHLGASLPNYMIPSRFEFRDALPLTPNGKIDRKALASGPMETGSVPTPATEAAGTHLLAIFRDVLGQSDVAASDSFFELGGHSLLAIKLVARIRKDLGAEVSLSTLFVNPSCQLLAQQIGNLPSVPSKADEAQTSVTIRPTKAPTTEGQREIFGAILFDPEQSLAYNLPFSIMIEGPLNTDAMQAALRDLVDRHDALRARFDESGLMMYFAPASGSEITVIDLTALSTTAQQAEMNQLHERASTKRFNLEQGGLFTAALVQLAEDRHEIIFTTHHIICDGWSVGILLEDLCALYLARTGQTAPMLMPVQSISQLSMAETHWNDTGGATRDLAFWQDIFAGDIPVLDLPTDHQRPRVKTSAGAQQRINIDPKLMARLRVMARQHGATVENVIFAAFNVFIARLSGSDDIVLGVPSAGQLTYGLERVVGHSVNFLPIRNRIDLNDSFSQLLGKVRKNQIAALEHKKLTFGALLRQLKIGRDRARIPLTPVAITFDNVIGAGGLAYPGLDARLVWHDRPYEHFELFVYVTAAADHLSLEWSYNTDIFEAETISHHMAQFTFLLDALSTAPGQALGALQVSAPVDREILLDHWQGNQVDFPRSATLPQIFKDRVMLHPDRVALFDGDKTIRYAELARRVDAIAQRLMARGVVQGDTVGIGLERSANMVAAMLATMQLGAAYVPLDPSNPAERLAYIAKDADLACIVSDIATAERLGFAQALTLDDLDAAEIANAPPIAEVAIDPLSTAYVAYTSGSTGKPKGVMGTHRAAMNRFSWMWREFPFTADEVMCQKTAISFVDSVWEIFGPLLAGVPQTIIGTTTVLEPKDFILTLARYKVTRLLVVPSLLKVLLGANIDLNTTVPSLKIVFCSGEVLPVTLARQFLRAAPNVQLINLYGSSEVAADVTCEVIRQIDTEAVSIGLPIDNARIYVLNEARNPVPLGEIGELYVGGEVLAAGYLNRPDLTAERFLSDPFITVPGARMFATGDLVCQLPDGRLMFKGRVDHQVKIRGARVELGEVELAIAGLPGVAEAVVVPGADDDGDVKLYAYIVAKGSTAPEPDVLRALLARQLPSYMVPTHIVILDQMPLNPNGKTDRAALVALSATATIARVDHKQVDASATDMLNIWQRLIGTDKIKPDDDFFVIGGHSLMAVKLFAQIRQTFGVELPISTLLEYPTPLMLLQRVKKATEAPVTLAASAFAGAPENAPWDTTAVIHPGPGNGAKALFIAGGVGGNVNNLFELGQFVGRNRPLIGLQTRGILGHRMHDTIEATAADHIVNMRYRQPKGPYLLAGYSGGVFSAFEMARQLRAAGETVAFLGLLDMTAPNFESNMAYPRIDRIKYQARLLRRHGLRPIFSNVSSWLNRKTNPALVRIGSRFWPEKFRYNVIMQHWQKLSAAYLSGTYDSSAWLYLTNSETDGFTVEQMRKIDPLFGWSGLVKGHLKVHRLEAKHLGMVAGASGYLLAEKMEDDIKTALRTD